MTVNVLPINDPPLGVQERTFNMLENGVLTVTAAQGVFTGAYDVDGKLLDALGNEVGSPLSATLILLPVTGTLNFNSITGEFEYTPPINFTGEVQFAYRLFDGQNLSLAPDYVVRITVNSAPPPAAPPNPGQVSVTYNLSNTPLEQSAKVPANVMVAMDDSGSMDWNLLVSGTDENGGFLISNSGIATRQLRSTSFVYLWDLSVNAYPPSSTYGRILPTEDSLAADSDTDNNEFGVWRARHSQFNTMYYNPEVRYEPWIGQDNLNVEFADADASNARLNPVDPTSTMDLLALHSYESTNVPEWDSSGGTTSVDVDTYLPYYYTTTASAPLQWNDAHTRIEIRPLSGPLAGGLFPGSVDRIDCAVDDNNPFTCTYAQEIQNFANWFVYARTREYVTKYGIGSVIAQIQDIRVGYETVSNTNREDIRPMNELHTEGNKKILLDNVYDVDSYGGTPLRQLLKRVGDTFACDRGTCPALPAPDGMCQQNFALLFTDGYWNGGSGISGNTDEDGPGSFDGGRYADTTSQTLADTAMYFYETDLFPLVGNQVPLSPRDIDGAPDGVFSPPDTMHQHMKTYTIAFGVQGTVDPTTVPTDPTTPFSWPDPFDSPQHKIDDLLHAATNGRGTYLNASNPQELKAGFEAAFLAFTQAASSTSSAAFNSTSLREGTLLYRGFYDLRDNTGELTATEVATDG
ncbi:MAG: Ig-like domain-containing protein, partial [Pseudomonadales bacterium]